MAATTRSRGGTNRADVNKKGRANPGRRRKTTDWKKKRAGYDHNETPMPTKERQRRKSTVKKEDGKRVVERGDGTKIIHAPGLPEIFVDRGGRGHLRIGKTTLELLAGEEDPATWTDEELLRGAPMRIKAVPKLVPLQVYQELVKRVQAKARYSFAAELEYAIKKHMEIIRNIDTLNPTAVQWSALKEVYDRILGEPEKNINVMLETPFMKMMAEALVGSDDDLPPDVIDITPIEENDGADRRPARADAS